MTAPYTVGAGTGARVRATPEDAAHRSGAQAPTDRDLPFALKRRAEEAGSPDPHTRPRIERLPSEQSVPHPFHEERAGRADNSRACGWWVAGTATRDAVNAISIANITKRSKSGQLPEAEACLQECRAAAATLKTHVDVAIYNALMTQYVRHNRIGDALRIYDLMVVTDAVAPDEPTCDLLVRALLNERRPDHALAMLDSMRQSGVRPGIATYTTLIGLCDPGDLDGVVARMEKDGVSPQPSTLVAMITAYDKSGRIDKVLALAEVLGTDDGPLPVDVSNAMMTACAKHGLIDHVRAIFERVPQPDPITYSILTGALVKHGRLDDALGVFKRTVDDGTILTSTSHRGGKPPADYMVGILVDACLAQDRLADAMWVFNAASDAGVRVPPKSYEDLVVACERSGCHEVSEALLDHGVRSGVLHPRLGTQSDAQLTLDFHRPSLYIHTSALSSANAEAGVRVDMAAALFRYHLLRGEFDSGARFIVGYHGNGAMKDTLLQVMAEAGMDPVSRKQQFGTLRTRNVAHNTDLRDKDLARVVRFGESLSGGARFYPEEFKRVLSVCNQHARDQRFAKQAVSLMDRMIEGGPRPDVECCNLLISIASRAGNIELALDTFRRVQISGDKPNLDTFLLLIEACELHGRRPEAQKLLGQAVEQGLLRPGLGFDARENILYLDRLHAAAELRPVERAALDARVTAFELEEEFPVPEAPAEKLSLALQVALLTYHRNAGNIKDDTRIVHA